MTDQRQAERERVAREFVETVLAQDVCLSEAECAIVQQATHNLLRAVEAATLEDVARHVQDFAQMEAHIGPLWNAGWTNAAEFFANTFRDQAQERRA